MRNRISVEDAKLANFSQLNDDNGALAQLNADVAAANATVAALVDDDVITSAEKKGIIPSYRIASRVRYKREEVLNSVTKVHSLKYRRA